MANTPITYGYSRGSTDPQVITLDQQGHTIKRYYEFRLEPAGHRFGGVFQDQGVSGGVRLIEREAGAALNSRLREGDAVIITKLDRGFRNCADAALTVDEWNRRGIAVHILDINVDTSTPIGRCMVQVIAAMAELERNRISERMKDTVAAFRRNGWAWGTEKKWGFKVQRVRHAGMGYRPTHVPFPEEREQMKAVYEMHAQGVTYENIREYLQAHWPLGKFTRTGGHRPNPLPWNIRHVHRMMLAEEDLQAIERGEQPKARTPKPRKRCFRWLTKTEKKELRQKMKSRKWRHQKRSVLARWVAQLRKPQRGRSRVKRSHVLPVIPPDSSP